MYLASDWRKSGLRADRDESVDAPRLGICIVQSVRLIGPTKCAGRLGRTGTKRLDQAALTTSQGYGRTAGGTGTPRDRPEHTYARTHTHKYIQTPRRPEHPTAAMDRVESTSQSASQWPGGCN
ncbi:unnamed protein product [Protopolystoma xenopodis]|uniref:Uncharacterized protein n=1 Tax=Protopolystoma xenopodis TaxID=117903 RepID=A0A448WRK1_9PLAT|nr:unnamed protein product [Protopolystoma xenopodis]